MSSGSMTTKRDVSKSKWRSMQRQRAPADRAEADHHDRAVDRAVDGPVGHCRGLLGCRRLSARSLREPRWRVNPRRPAPGVRALPATIALPQYLALERRRAALDGDEARSMKRSRMTVALLRCFLPLGRHAVGGRGDLRSGNAGLRPHGRDRSLANFYAPDRARPFREAVALTVDEPARARQRRAGACVDDAIDFVLASLETSHTAPLHRRTASTITS